MRLDSDIKKLKSSCYKKHNSSSKYLFEEETDQSHGSNDSLLPGMYDDVALLSLARVSRFDYASLSCLNIRFNSFIKSVSLRFTETIRDNRALGIHGFRS